MSPDVQHQEIKKTYSGPAKLTPYSNTNNTPQYRSPPPYPDDFEVKAEESLDNIPLSSNGSISEKQRGPPPPYFSPSASVISSSG